MNNLTSVVYRKDRLPVVLGADAVDVRYSAASNPSDPVGSGSINSTSRNWSASAGADVEYMLDAALQKTDLWDRVDRRGDTVPHADGYFSRFFAWQTALLADKTRPWRDEGYLVDVVTPFKPDESANPPEHGAYMPGFDKPYESNDPQTFQQFDAANSQFASGYIPVTDVDDQGRVNPFPLMRVEVVQKGTGQRLAATDAIMTAGRDHHCRECHAKGKIAANPATQWTEEAFHSSLYGQQNHQASCGEGHGGHNHGTHLICDFAPPQFFDPTGPSLREQEDAAMKNIYSLHDFYDGLNMLGHRETGAWELNEAGARVGDGSYYCSGCHISPTRFWTMGVKMWDDYFAMDETNDYWPNYTMTMHKFHGRLQRDPTNPDQIRREPGGFPKLWDPAQGENPNTLFPVKTASGESKPMAENCLQCHAGQRESCYRDRMDTAGVTCFDCHGDMLAQGLAYEKSRISPDGNKYRVAYYDEPDCGSCHTGDANESGTGFFSGGILKRAFAASDLSATPLEPKRERFAVPLTDQGTHPVEDWITDPPKALEQNKSAI
ncbi:hypothetical protein [Methylococcus sp. Mc7]|uniref:hypothetical protein n=1 Tax=Methylococcus sp. Mc7 TaxID=2860258 RepID=UPI001C52B7C3|nr:hypothetical protein [Methylococcus sp. Mc7]QXP84407.1 hypothetical protein KW115_01140 [Methylococcus sp. Mc7]